MISRKFQVVISTVALLVLVCLLQSVLMVPHNVPAAGPAAFSTWSFVQFSPPRCHCPQKVPALPAVLWMLLYLAVLSPSLESTTGLCFNLMWTCIVIRRAVWSSCLPKGMFFPLFLAKALVFAQLQDGLFKVRIQPDHLHEPLDRRKTQLFWQRYRLLSDFACYFNKLRWDPLFMYIGRKDKNLERWSKWRALIGFHYIPNNLYSITAWELKMNQFFPFWAVRVSFTQRHSKHRSGEEEGTKLKSGSWSQRHTEQKKLTLCQSHIVDVHKEAVVSQKLRMHQRLSC